MTSKDDKQDSEEEVDVDELLDTIFLPQETFLASPEISKDSVHSSVIDDNLPKTCNLCGITCPNRVRLDFHNQLRHNIQKMLECDICQEKFQTDLYLKLHKKKEHSHPDMCATCGLKLKNNREWMIHKQHHKTNPGRDSNKKLTRLLLTNKKLSPVFDLDAFKAANNSSNQVCFSKIVNTNAKKVKIEIPIKSKPENILIKKDDGVVAVSEYSNESWSWKEIDIEIKTPRYSVASIFNDPLDDDIRQAEINEIKNKMNINGITVTKLTKQIKKTSIREEIEDFTVPCGLCQQYFPNERARNKHQNKKHHTGPFFYCLQCKKKFRNDANLRTHQRMHVGCNTFQLCTKCNVEFPSMYLLHQHLKIEHVKKYSVMEGNGMKSLKEENFNNLSPSIARSSSTDQKQAQLIDDWMQTSQSEFVLMNGEGVRDLGLQISHVAGNCGDKSAVIKNTMKYIDSQPSSSEHQNQTRDASSINTSSFAAASPRVIYRCEICHKRYRNKASVQLHMRQIHLKLSYNCTSCDQKFARMPHLKAHQIENHLALTLEIYQCPELNCNRRFGSRYSLHVHSRSHFSAAWNIKRRTIEGLSFICDKCGKKLFKRKELTSHMYRHKVKEASEEMLRKKIEIANKAAFIQLQKPKHKEIVAIQDDIPKQLRTKKNKLLVEPKKNLPPVNSVEINAYDSDKSEDCILILEQAECIIIDASDDEL